MRRPRTRSTGSTQPVSPQSQLMGRVAATAAAAGRAAAKRTPSKIEPSPPVRDAGADARDLDVSSFPSFMGMAMEQEPPAYSSSGKRVVSLFRLYNAMFKLRSAIYLVLAFILAII